MHWTDEKKLETTVTGESGNEGVMKYAVAGIIAGTVLGLVVLGRENR